MTEIAFIPLRRGPIRDKYSPFRSYARNCRRRERHTDITAEYLRELWDSQGGICPLTGWELLIPETTRGQGAVKPNTASLDRIEEDLGYCRGNVRWVAYMVNIGINIFSDKQFIGMCNAVSRRNGL